MKLSDATITIVGLGLMGGSLGKALVSGGACRQVRGLVRRQAAAQEAVALGAVHLAGTDSQQLLAEADLVVFSTPVLTIERQISTHHQFMEAGAIITDMGSVKRNIMQAMEQLPPQIRAVGGHPMCGKETPGLQASDPDLFRGKAWVLTRANRTDPDALELIEEMIRVVGAQPLLMSADDHDLIAACVSHLPYLLAATLVAVAEETALEKPDVWNLASSGFRDTSRVAGGDLTMMMDILAANKDSVLHMLETAQRIMRAFTRSMVDNDEAGLRAALSHVHDRRASMFNEQLSPEEGTRKHG
ncbi:MAG: prephenate dehydrogenase [Desulfomonilaceae bacterium]